MLRRDPWLATRGPCGHNVTRDSRPVRTSAEPRNTPQRIAGQKCAVTDYALQQGVDRSVIALWLGHESIETTEMYLHASMAMKEKALAKATSSKTRNGRYRPTDRLLAFLKSL
jgi:integrase